MSELVNLRNEIVKVATSYVGKKEKKNNGGFLDPQFEREMRSIGFQTGHAWCMLFVEMVWRKAYKIWNAIADTEMNKLFSASVMQTRNNFVNAGKKHGFKLSQTGEPGDIVIWQSRRNRALGHTGILTTSVTKNSKDFNTIEGNTNASGGREGVEVARKYRMIKSSGNLQLIGFISPVIIEEAVVVESKPLTQTAPIATITDGK